MAKYALFFSYTPESWAGMIKNPSDRSGAARQLAESVGGRIEAFYWMFGDYDGFAIVDGPDSISAAAVSVAVAASGALSKAVTTELFDAEDQAAVMERARTAVSSYIPPAG
ncbi:MAG: GYD domain-containing protein [Actinobacteria bacterium]|nr:MAG: GYD domain-containing protein [Actinomycetota bacterium]